MVNRTISAPSIRNAETTETGVRHRVTFGQKKDRPEAATSGRQSRTQAHENDIASIARADVLCKGEVS